MQWMGVISLIVMGSIGVGLLGTLILLELRSWWNHR
jgi:hypothetical protein